MSAQEIQTSQDNFYSTNIQEQQQNEKYTFKMGVKQNHFQVMWPAGKQVLLKPYWLANKGGPRTAEIPPPCPCKFSKLLKLTGTRLSQTEKLQLTGH